MILSLKAELAVACIDIEAASTVEGAQWEPFQLQLLNNIDRFGIDVKSRQIAWSFTAALDAIMDSVIEAGNPHIFVSINQNEANEKIRYANAILDAWHSPPGYPPKPKVTRSNMGEIEFSNKSRLISYPCKPVRGPPKGRVYLDEMAHYRLSLQEAIHTGALPSTVKGGYIRIGSSPLGASGLFWEIFTAKPDAEKKQFSGYQTHKRSVPWWRVKALCKDVKAASLVAPQMETRERVYAFGTSALIQIFENMFLEDFRQEFECDWVDESVAFHPWAEIQVCQDDFGEGTFFDATNVDDALLLVDKIKEAISTRKIEPVLLGGVDIGRTHDLTEFVALGRTITGQMPYRFGITLRNTEYDTQQAVFYKVISELPFTQVLVDNSGIGAQLAENLEKKTKFIAQGVTFTNPNKELWAVEVRVQMQRRNTPIPIVRDFANQIHSIKKVVTAAKNYVFDAQRNEKGHADKYWAWALAIWAGHKRPRGGGVVF